MGVKGNRQVARDRRVRQAGSGDNILTVASAITDPDEWSEGILRGGSGESLKRWCTQQGSNLRPFDSKSNALSN